MQVLQVSFQYFNIERGQNCQNDALQLLDGMDPTTSPELGKLCGNVIPAPVTSTGQSMIIVFSTDEAINQGGFVLNWNSIDPIRMYWLVFSSLSLDVYVYCRKPASRSVVFYIVCAQSMAYIENVRMFLSYSTEVNR